MALRDLFVLIVIAQAQATSYLGSCQFVSVNRSITWCNPCGPICFEGSLPMYRNCNSKSESRLLWQVLRKWQDNTVFNFIQGKLLVGFWRYKGEKGPWYLGKKERDDKTKTVFWFPIQQKNPILISNSSYIFLKMSRKFWSFWNFPFIKFF